MGRRVKEEGESEGPAVMAGIPVEPRRDHRPRKRAHFPLVSPHESVGSTNTGGVADDGGLIRWCYLPRVWRALAPNQYREGGSSAAASGNGRWRGLSRMPGNWPVRFLGGRGEATPLAYPTASLLFRL